MLVRSSPAPAQDISFYHLSTASGLSDNLVTAAARDQYGILWIGTAEGLNTYDGFTIKKYFTEEYPALGSNHIGDIFCDDQNRVWIRSINGRITLADEKRNLVRVPVLAGGKNIDVSFICQTRSRGIIAIFRDQLFSLQKNNGNYTFEKMNWAGNHAFIRSNFQQASERSDTLIFSGNNRVVIFDAGSLKVLHDLTIPAVIGAVLLNEREILATTENNRELLKINLATRTVTRNYGLLPDQYNQPVNSYLRHIRKLKDGRFIISSGYGGVYIFNSKTETLHRYQHDALDDRSVSANNTSYVYTESSGFAYVATRSAGLNYFHSELSPASYKSAFQETNGGKIFHGFINCITQHPNGNLWMGSQTGLIEWDRKQNKTRFHAYGEKNGIPLEGAEEVRAICIDNQDKIWLGLSRFGIVVLGPGRKPVRYLTADSIGQKPSLPGNYITHIAKAPDEKLWVSTGTGLCRIDPVTYRADPDSTHPLLAKLSKTASYTTWFAPNGDTWTGTNKGAFQYDAATGQIIFLHDKNGLPSNNVISFTADAKGNVYIGTSNGMAIVRDHRVVKTYTKQNGLRNDRCFGLLTDQHNIVWIGNDNVLVSYNPADSSFQTYDEGYGLSPYGFRQLAYYQAGNGEQFWGSDIGLSSFFPANLQQLDKTPVVRISSFTAGNKSMAFTDNELTKIPYADNNLLFSFSAVDLFGSKHYLYEYRLEGADKSWIRANASQQVIYSNLGPGRYTFKVRVSKDGNQWVESVNPVQVQIQTPWWKSTWFILLTSALCAAMVVSFFRRRTQKLQVQKEQLETEAAINYFASSMYDQKTADDILWDVTRNCISRLKFEDCVIYMKDETRNVLVQKAAWGPKTSGDGTTGDREAKILNPIDIPVGKGIVGTVAATGIAEIIPDTSLDSRYIVDDVRRLSEIAVPIIFDNKVIGVIDSEHPKKNFFTSKHLSILGTIASLCANKIVRSQAEEARQKAQLELLEHQRKMAEAQLKSLRLQMSPHFLFNALNSIQQIILSGNDAAATRYLSKFSRLLRLVLQHSDREKIPLKEEVETLGLYLELEALRFEDSFVYTITVDKNMDTEEIKIPTLLVQPFVENAIWHGLLHLPEERGGIRKLSVRFSEDSNDNLICVVEDNGIGREAARRKSGSRDTHTGKGLSVAEERVKTFNEQNARKSSFNINDLYDEAGNPLGTSVTISLPLIK